MLYKKSATRCNTSSTHSETYDEFVHMHMCVYVYDRPPVVTCIEGREREGIKGRVHMYACVRVGTFVSKLAVRWP